MSKLLIEKFNLKTKNTNLSVAWQNLASFAVAKKLDLSVVEKIESVFVLLQNFLLELTEFENFIPKPIPTFTHNTYTPKNSKLVLL